MARAAIGFFWILYSNGDLCLINTPFVVKYFKGLSNEKKVLKPVKKAYPISYDELQQLFINISKGKRFHCLIFYYKTFYSDDYTGIFFI